jgi:hypothetical protein
VKKEVLNLVNEYLPGVLEYLGILLEQHTPVSLVGLQPRVNLIDFIVQNSAPNNAKQKLNGHPDIQVPVGISKIDLKE